MYPITLHPSVKFAKVAHGSNMRGLFDFPRLLTSQDVVDVVSVEVDAVRVFDGGVAVARAVLGDHHGRVVVVHSDVVQQFAKTPRNRAQPR